MLLIFVLSLGVMFLSWSLLFVRLWNFKEAIKGKKLDFIGMVRGMQQAHSTIF